VTIPDDGSGVQSVADTKADRGRSVKSRAEKWDSVRRAPAPSTQSLAKFITFEDFIADPAHFSTSS
jgi:hypothetical protein